MGELIGIALAGFAGYLVAQFAAPIAGSIASASATRRALDQIAEHNREQAINALSKETPKDS